MTIENKPSLVEQIKEWGKALGFADIGITNCDLSAYENDFFQKVENGLFGEMDYMHTHGTKRTRPVELVPGTQSLISVRMNYFDLHAENALGQLHRSHSAYISRYALGKDYHKLLRKRLKQLAKKIQTEVPNLEYRAFTDSAPVLEQSIAQKSGLGFIGKNSLLIHPRAGSWFFLGELYLNIELPSDPPFEKQGCGPCTACIQECPTQAILENNQIDARRCISYLTIEYSGVIPNEFRRAMGNRIYGCDDCQLVCPWNRFANPTQESGFESQYALDNANLIDLWAWDESTFLKHFEGSAIRRIGFEKWRRNLAIALGNIENAAYQKEALKLLQNCQGETELVQVHIDWAIESLQKNINNKTDELLTKLSRKSLPAGKVLNAHATQTIRPFVAKKYYYPADKIKTRH